MKNNAAETIIIASASPRRHDILRQMGLKFEAKPQNVDETFTGRAPEDEAVHLAEKKALSCLESEKEASMRWLIAADTFIAADNILLGKPNNRTEARRMLEILSGKTHRVITGLALGVPGKKIQTACCTTEVKFSLISDAEIDWYLDTGEWKGAAAAYRIQEKGAVFVESISGSYSNVMGLPINTIYGMLRANNFNFRD